MKAQSASDIAGSKSVLMTEFIDSIRGFDLIGTLMSLQKLAAMMGTQAMVSVNVEFAFCEIPKHQIKVGTLTRDFISFFAKHTILNCGDTDIQYNEANLVDLVYKYGNLETDLDQLRNQGLAEEQGWLWPIRATNHQWMYLRYYSMIIGRYSWIFAKVVEEDAELGEKLNIAIGIDIMDAMKIGTCISANYCPQEGRISADSFLMESYTNTTVENLKPLLTEANIHKFFDIFATTPEQFREEAKKFVLPDPQLKKYEFNPLKRFPVIKTSSKKDVETFIIPSQADFLYACFEGIYYVMLDRLGKKDKDTLWKVMGTVFEKYVGEVIKFNEIEAHSDACLFPEILYKIGKAEWKTVDWILVSDKYIVQIECKKRKIDNYARAGIQNAEGVGIDRVLEDLAIVSDKLIVKEQHIRAGKVPDISYKGQTFINLAVFLDEMFALNQYARDKIRAKMQQQSDNFYIVGCYEFEMICQQSKNKQQDIGQSVRDLTTGQCDIYKIDFLNEEYRRFFDRLMHTA